MTVHLKERVKILKESLPYIQKFEDHTFVIKYGGSAMETPQKIAAFAENIVLLKNSGINIIVVHGGGPQISTMLGLLGRKSNFIDGVRVTSKEDVEIVEMVLSGSTNKGIVQAINKAGGLAIGLSGKDANLIHAKKLHHSKYEPDSNIERITDLGFVGKPDKINTEILEVFSDTPIIPVISPVGFDNHGNTYNINADTAAGAIACAIGANKLILLTDVDGVCHSNGELISSLSIHEAKKMIKTGEINGGMVPKVLSCIDVIEKGVSSVHILNGNVEDVLLLEVLTTSGIGTMIVS